MKILFIFCTLVFILYGCASNSPHSEDTVKSSSYYQGGDGSSFEQAVIFPNAKSSIEGIPLERKWISEKFPGYKKKQQAAISHEGKFYDKITIVTVDGVVKEFYFDMTSWFGLPE